MNYRRNVRSAGADHGINPSVEGPRLLGRIFHREGSAGFLGSPEGNTGAPKLAQYKVEVTLIQYHAVGDLVISELASSVDRGVVQSQG